jgi:predicted dienelactone hydrolase
VGGWEMNVWLTLVLIVMLVGTLLCCFKVKPKKSRYLLVVWILVCGISLVFQLQNTGFLWTMLPAYLILIISVIVLVRRTYLSGRNVPKRIFKRLYTSIFIVLIFIALIVPTYAFPIIKIKSPEGPYDVGSTVRYFKDMNRKETRTEEPDDYRELMVQIWYPISKKEENQRREPYHSHGRFMVEELARQMNMPAFLFSTFQPSLTNALFDAPVATNEKNYPVLLFSHGFGGHRAQNTFQMEHLASNGYIVFSIEHTYSAVGTVLPNDRKMHMKGSLLEWPKEQEVQRDLDEWSQDARFIADQLTVLNQEDSTDLFFGKLNLDKLGYLGHSFGGVVAAKTLIDDSRFKAGMNMDGYIYGEFYKVGVKQPFVHFGGEGLLPSDSISEQELQSLNISKEEYRQFEEQEEERIDKLVRNGYQLKLSGGSHFDFTDFALWSPIGRYLGLTGDLSARQTHNIVNKYTLSFFDQELKEKKRSLIEIDDPHVAILKVPN